MRNIFALSGIIPFLLLTVCAQAAGLPDSIPVKCATRSFTHEYVIAVDEGRLWFKPQNSPGKQSTWKLLGRTGLPHSDRAGFIPPVSIHEVSSDGDNLVALGNNGVIYYMKWSTRKWTDQWGLPFAHKLHLPQKIRSWSISHRGSFTGGYSDLDGNFHPIWAGVTTLYILSEDGLKIGYADPWLPGNFQHEICLPRRNRFRARALAASASTLFVINDAGEMYTRLADFDTLGHNPLLAYSYERKGRNLPEEKDVRTLPPEGWKKQPSIRSRQGRISSCITIFQTGTGNDARTLRVEGVNPQGVHGYFSKPLVAEAWTFTRTDAPLHKPLLLSDSKAAADGPTRERTLFGYLKTSEKYAIRVERFNPPCAEAKLVVAFDEIRWTFPLVLTASSATDRRMNGAVFLTDDARRKTSQNEKLNRFVKKVFGKTDIAQIRLHIDKKGQIEIHLR